MENQSKEHEDQVRHNMVLMMEMQDTIQGLRQELAELSKEPVKSVSYHLDRTYTV